MVRQVGTLRAFLAHVGQRQCRRKHRDQNGYAPRAGIAMRVVRLGDTFLHVFDRLAPRWLSLVLQSG